MSTQSEWTPLRSLDDRKGVSRGPGVYLIGLHDPTLANVTADKDYYGKNYPSAFRPRYVGMTMSLQCGIARRLWAHARGRGNLHVKDFILTSGIKNLFYTYSRLTEGDFAEVILLMHQSDNVLDWNDKGELLGAAKRFFFQHGPPEPLLLDHFEPEEQMAEFESKRRLAAQWEALLDANPKYKRIAKQRKG